MRFADLSSAKSWSREKASDSSVRLLDSGLSLASFKIELRASCQALAGKRLLFFSDLHARSLATSSLAPFKGGFLRWSGLDWIFRALSEAVAASKPDFIVFGGDLVVHSCWLEAAMRMLAGVGRGVPKLAVYGNWDKRRRRWLPHGVWSELYGQAGFRLLVNEEAVAGPLRVWGMDDFKMGVPRYAPPSPSAQGLFNCVVAHNPDSVLRAMTDADLAGVDLILCGHTHGGQWRLPVLGAFFTSSRHWKSFELGLYKRKDCGARLLVCAGIGATAFRSRFNCPPEAVLVDFV